MRKTRLMLAALALSATAAPNLAAGQEIAALALNGDKLFLISEGAKGFKVQKTVKLKVKASDRILAMDMRAADGRLYGVSEKSNVFRINPKNGKVEKQFSLGTRFAGAISMDCNAAVDACRLLSDAGANARFTFTGRTLISDANLTYATGVGQPRVVAAAYTNSFPGAAATELFDIDAETDKVYEQDPPNGGVLNLIAKVRTKVEWPVAFDVASFGEGDNLGLMIYRKRLYRFSFTTGEFSAPAEIKGLGAQVRDLAWLGAPR